MEVKRVLIEIVLVILLLLLVAGLVSVFNTLIPPESAGLLGGVMEGKLCPGIGRTVKIL
ncbi:hypothetical protein [Thermococcus sp. LS2]|uniref:hypothetical protein n=1 Tax=Thermococcus sp. LS2 TaxID=1638260 RepID=UPI00143AFB46|nr:hypothetical protein [Thermococcus sp. LS2]